MCFLLTNNTQYNHHKFKYVPPIITVVLSQSDNFETALYAEDHDENEVDPVQDFFLLRTLLVCFHHHRQRIKADQHHDENVKKWIGHKVEDQTLKLVLERNRSQVVQNSTSVNSLVLLEVYRRSVNILSVGKEVLWGSILSGVLFLQGKHTDINIK